MRFGSMVNLIIDEFSEDELTKRYSELVNKETWDEICKNCRMPFLLHNGACTRSKEAGMFDSGRILDERDKFVERMKPIIRYMSEQEEKMVQNDGQNELVRELKKFVGAVNAREGKTAKIVKPAKVPT